MREHDSDLVRSIKRACPKGSGARKDLTSRLDPVRGKIPRPRMGLVPRKGIKIVRVQFGIYIFFITGSPRKVVDACARQSKERIFCYIRRRANRNRTGRTPKSSRGARRSLGVRRECALCSVCESGCVR